jgi:hypothetical protein
MLFLVDWAVLLLKMYFCMLKRVKCSPILLYAIEACPLNSRDLQSLDFVVTIFLYKCSRTNSLHLINECHMYFNSSLVSKVLKYLVIRFTEKFYCN